MGFANYMQQGSFIVPFPFISEFIFVIASGIFILEFKNRSIYHLLLLLFATFGVLAGRFIWEIILNFEQLQYVFEETIVIDVFRIIQYLLVFVLLLLLAFRLSEFKKRITLAICGVMLPFVLLANGANILSIWYVVLAIFSFGALRFGDEVEVPMKSVIEGLVGIGLLYALTLVTQVVV